SSLQAGVVRAGKRLGTPENVAGPTTLRAPEHCGPQNIAGPKTLRAPERWGPVAGPIKMRVPRKLRIGADRRAPGDLPTEGDTHMLRAMVPPLSSPALRLRLTLALLVAALGIIPASAQDALRIGVTQPLTGAFAASGNYVAQGAKLAEEEINKAGGVLGKRIE